MTMSTTTPTTTATTTTTLVDEILKVCECPSNFLALPCCVVQQQQQQQQQQEQQRRRLDYRCHAQQRPPPRPPSPSLLPPWMLTYASAGHCLKLHQTWLENTLETFEGGGGGRRGGSGGGSGGQKDVKDDDDDDDDDDDPRDDVVVAYLSGNSMDFLFSVLACTQVGAATAATTTTTPVRPALLNTRWTPLEIMAVLTPQLPEKGSLTTSSSTKFVTLLLYDEANEGTARRVVQLGAALMKQKQQEEKHHHVWECRPLPRFAHMYLEPMNQKSTLSSLSSQSYPAPRHCTPTSQSTTKWDNTDALILFTSGTTGGCTAAAAKGVRLSHRALLVQAFAKLETSTCNYDSQTTMLATTVAMYHVGGLSSCLAVLLGGGSLVWPASSSHTNKDHDGGGAGGGGGFHVEDVTTSLQDPSWPTNTLVVVPAMMAAFFDGRNISVQRRFPKVRLILMGGQSASEEMVRRIRYTFPNARLVQTYACTEAASSLTFWEVVPLEGIVLEHRNRQQPSDDDTTTASRRPTGDCVGVPPRHISLQLFRRRRRHHHHDDDDDDDQAHIDSTSHDDPARVDDNDNSIIRTPFEVGIIGSRGPHLMNGYWRRGQSRGEVAQSQDAIASSSLRWFLSGDLGFWDDQGRLYFSGRVKDVIRTGGETVMAQEVERILLRHPSVEECAIFPRVDERFGEAVSCALVVKKQQPPLELQVIKEWCRKYGLAGYKHPKFLFLVEALPRNSSGKVLKHKLVAQFGHSMIQSKL